MNKKGYYLCSESVIKHFPNSEKSKPFKSGYDFDKDENYYVAVLNFDEVKNVYDKLSDDEQDYFWTRELCVGSMDVSEIKLSRCKKYGLLIEIERILGLTTERNIAMTIYNLANYHNCTPIEFINKIA